MNHTPVMTQEMLKYLNPQNGECIIDGTFGGGGHTRAILERTGSQGRVIAIDWNAEAMSACRLIPGVECFQDNMAHLAELFSEHNLPRAQGLVLDLGFSSDELDHSGRGFSFKKDEPLLMTYNDESPSVRDILRAINEQELASIIRTLSGERYANRIACAISEQRRKAPIQTTYDLVRVIVNVMPKGYEHNRIHPATRTFQALRMYANKELENIEQTLKSIEEILDSGARIVIISFHSLEDRIVKQYFNYLKKEGQADILTKKPIRASIEEMQSNPRSRSAKLRAVRLI